MLYMSDEGDEKRGSGGQAHVSCTSKNRDKTSQKHRKNNFKIHLTWKEKNYS